MEMLKVYMLEWIVSLHLDKFSTENLQELTEM